MNSPKETITRIFFALTLGLSLLHTANLNAQEDQKQYWQGVLDLGAAKLTLNIEINKNEEGHSAVIYAVEQGNAEIPVDETKITDEQITLELTSIKARFEGKIDDSGQACLGTFSQHGMDFELELKRVNSFDADEDEGEMSSTGKARSIMMEQN